ncbi:MAG: hypothetical protein ACRDRL_28005, partial [Sciscionella sp.]
GAPANTANGDWFPRSRPYPPAGPPEPTRTDEQAGRRHYAEAPLTAEPAAAELTEVDSGAHAHGRSVADLLAANSPAAAGHHRRRHGG